MTTYAIVHAKHGVIELTGDMVRVLRWASAGGHPIAELDGPQDACARHLASAWCLRRLGLVMFANGVISLSREGTRVVRRLRIR